MSDIGIGVDIEENQRFIGLADNQAFLNKFYTEQEIIYCLSKPNPAQHFAVRFAAKEAVIKALNQLGLKKIGRRDIEVVSHGNNAPTVEIKKSQVKWTVKLSLSHSKIESVAVVIIIKN